MRRLPGRGAGRAESVRAQEERKRERHARDGVWRPAGGEHPAARGLPGSRHPAKPRDCKGAGHRPLTRPRQAAGWQIAPADRGGTAQAASITPRAAHLAEAQPQFANPCPDPAGSRATLDSYNSPSKFNSSVCRSDPRSRTRSTRAT